MNAFCTVGCLQPPNYLLFLATTGGYCRTSNMDAMYQNYKHGAPWWLTSYSTHHITQPQRPWFDSSPRPSPYIIGVNHINYSFSFD